MPVLPSEAITPDGAGGAFADLLIQPGASRTAVAGGLDGRIKIAVAAPPVDGKANEVLLQFLKKKTARFQELSGNYLRADRAAQACACGDESGESDGKIIGRCLIFSGIWCIGTPAAAERGTAGCRNTVF